MDRETLRELIVDYRERVYFFKNSRNTQGAVWYRKGQAEHSRYL